MKTTFKHTIMASVLAVSMSGCGDFLEESSQNMAYLEKVQDMNELLMGDGYLPRNYSYDLESDGLNYWTNIKNYKTHFPAILLMDDDIEEYTYGAMDENMERRYGRLMLNAMHNWQPNPMLDWDLVERYKDDHWAQIYKRIAITNTIIYQIDQTNYTQQEAELAQRVKGESYFLRAQFYLMLANIYGRPYCKERADVEGCIPLKTSPGVVDELYSRTPMNTVYSQIVSDLESAIQTFGDLPPTSAYRANAPAAKALLSRVLLYMERYEEALRWADEVLADKKHRVNDLNDYREGNSALWGSSADVLFTQGPSYMPIIHTPIDKTRNYTSGYTTSPSLQQAYHDDDLRLKAYYVPRADNTLRCIKTRKLADGEVSDMYAIRMAEVLLNKAEAHAMLGQDAEARQAINDLLVKRFTPENVAKVTLTDESGEQLVNAIRDERRRELCYEGHRWFDLRRYAVNSKYPLATTITHRSFTNDKGDIQVRGTFTLHPFDEEPGAWVFPIPTDEIEFNEGKLMNEERKERELQ